MTCAVGRLPSDAESGFDRACGAVVQGDPARKSGLTRGSDRVARVAVHYRVRLSRHRSGGTRGTTGCAKGGGKLHSNMGMPVAGLTASPCGKAPSDRPALKPYWGKPAVRNFREGDGNVGIIRSPVRAITLPDKSPCPDLERARGRRRPRALDTPTRWAWGSCRSLATPPEPPSESRELAIKTGDPGVIRRILRDPRGTTRPDRDHAASLPNQAPVLEWLRARDRDSLELRLGPGQQRRVAQGSGAADARPLSSA